MYLTQGHYRLILVSVAAALLAGCQQSSPQSPSLGNLPGPHAGDDLDPKVNATTYFSHGHLLERQGQFDRAALQYQNALTQRPDFLTARNRLGITLNKIGRHDEASIQFQAAIVKHPELAYLHNNLGFSQYLEGKYADAATAIKQALAINPEFRRAHMNYALVLAKQGEFKQAFEHLLEAGSEANAYFNMGIMLTEAEQYGEAAQYLEAALSLNPKFEAARQQLHDVARLAAEKEAIDAAKLAAAQVESESEDAETGEPGEAVVQQDDMQGEEQIALAEQPTDQTTDQQTETTDPEDQPQVALDQQEQQLEQQEEPVVEPTQANVALAAEPAEQVAFDDTQENLESDPNCDEFTDANQFQTWPEDQVFGDEWGPPVASVGWATSGEGGEVDLEFLQELIDAAYWASVNDSDQEEWLWCELSYYLFPETAPETAVYPLAEDEWEEWQSPVMYYVESEDEEVRPPVGK